MGKQGQRIAAFEAGAGEARAAGAVRDAGTKRCRWSAPAAASDAVCSSSQRVWIVGGDEVGMRQDRLQERDVGADALQPELAECAGRPSDGGGKIR